jgi:cytochrome bd-type quinol oxidase subunit 2
VQWQGKLPSPPIAAVKPKKKKKKLIYYKAATDFAFAKTSRAITYLSFILGHSFFPCLIEETIQVTRARSCGTQSISNSECHTQANILH